MHREQPVLEGLVSAPQWTPALLESVCKGNNETSSPNPMWSVQGMGLREDFLEEVTFEPEWAE